MFPYILDGQGDETFACGDVSGRLCPEIVNATVVDRDDSTYIATYLPTQSGYYYMHATMALPGGLIASYWDRYLMNKDEKDEETEIINGEVIISFSHYRT